MKKAFSVIAAAAMLLSLSACSQKAESCGVRLYKLRFRKTVGLRKSKRNTVISGKNMTF